MPLLKKELKRYLHNCVEKYFNNRYWKRSNPTICKIVECSQRVKPLTTPLFLVEMLFYANWLDLWHWWVKKPYCQKQFHSFSLRKSLWKSIVHWQWCPVLLIELSLAFVTAIKTEAILSFLGLGVKNGISWGLMLSEASSEVVAGHYQNFLSASVFMFVLVMAFNQFSDALQDALDPKKVV